MDETQAETLALKASICALQVVVTALVSAHPNQKQLKRFIDLSAQTAGASPPLDVQPGKKYFQQSLDRLCAGLHIVPDRPRRF